MACAMLAIQLDNFLGGEPIQHRNVQGYENPDFMALFPRGVSYKVRLSNSIYCIYLLQHKHKKKAANKNLKKSLEGLQ